MTDVTTTGGKTFMGHPRGLVVLFFAEMWERFSYYGMRALLILYLTKFWLFNDAKGNLTQARNNQGQIIRLRYNASARISQMLDINLSEHTRRELRFKYNQHGKPTEIDTVVISTQHHPDISQEQIKEAVIEENNDRIAQICREHPGRFAGY